MFIEVKNLCKTYKSGSVDVQALSKASFKANKGEIIVVLGPSGSGKSTLLNILGGIDRCSSGFAKIGGENITDLSDKKLLEYRRKEIGFIFQFYNLIPNLTVKENIAVSFDIAENPLDLDQLLSDVGLISYKNRFPRELSGGQQQRVSIARALVKNPSLIFCDEPTGALDMHSSIEVLSVLENMSIKYQTTVLIITHNTSISSMAHRVIKLRDGMIVENKMNERRLTAKEVLW